MRFALLAFAAFAAAHADEKPARDVAVIPTLGINFGGGFQTITTPAQRAVRARPTIQTEGIKFGHGPHIIHPPAEWLSLLVPRAAETIPTDGINPGGVFETLPPPEATSTPAESSDAESPAPTSAS